MQNPDSLFGRLGNRLFQMSYIYAKFREGAIPDIYVQDYLYFDKYGSELKKIFGNGINQIDYVALHVRRGDYVNNPFYIDLWQTDYYEKAIQEFSDERFMIFSDDIEWCRENFIGKEYTFNEEKTDYEAMNTMASCKGIIMANSSFSWWAAYLSNCGKVIAPRIEHWYTNGEELTKCPPDWIRL